MNSLTVIPPDMSSSMGTRLSRSSSGILRDIWKNMRASSLLPFDSMHMPMMASHAGTALPVCRYLFTQLPSRHVSLSLSSSHWYSSRFSAPSFPEQALVNTICSLTPMHQPMALADMKDVGSYPESSL